MAVEPRRVVQVEKLATLGESELLEQMIDTGVKPRDEAGRTRAMSLIQNYLEQIIDPGTKVDPNVIRTINDRIAAIDQVLTEQLDQILHHPDFQKLEASWRGLHKLVTNTETSETLKIRVLNISKGDLHKDLVGAVEFTESQLWKKVYEYAFGLFGGDPFGALVADYEFDKGPLDIELLTRVSEVAAASHAPFIAAASPQMFGMDSMIQMPDPRDLAKIFNKANPENIKWLSFRDSPDSRFVAMVVPHVLRRLPYADGTNPVEDFSYNEDVSGSHDSYLWGSAAYEFANGLTAAFAKHHWCVAIRGPEGGGLVEGLPIHLFKSKEGDIGSKCPTEVLIPDTREKELSDLGFIGLLHCQNTDYAAFFGGNSVQRPTQYDTAEATANAKLSSQIPYLMATSRIAHYLKAIGREKVGSFMSRSEVETLLNRWVAQYVLLQDDASQSEKAQRPLRDARVDVTDDKSRPGCYRAIAYLRPHFQLDELGISLRLVADLPPPKA